MVDVRRVGYAASSRLVSLSITMKLHLPICLRAFVLSLLSLGATLSSTTLTGALVTASIAGYAQAAEHTETLEAGGALTLTPGDSYTITHAGNATLTLSEGEATLGSISGTSEGRQVTLEGNGTVVTGEVSDTLFTVHQGTTLKLGADVAFADGTTGVSLNGGTLDLNGNTLSGGWAPVYVGAGGGTISGQGTISGIGALRQNGALLTVSGVDTVVETERYIGSDSIGAHTELLVCDGATFTVSGAIQSNVANNNTSGASFMLGHWQSGGLGTLTVNNGGTVNVRHTGISVKHGSGVVNVENGGTLNIKSLSSNISGDVSVALAEGGVINIGSGGIRNLGTITITGGKLGILSDTTAWTASNSLTLSGNLTIDTELYDADTKSYTGEGGTITLNAGLNTAGHSLTKAGEGSLVLGADAAIDNLVLQQGLVDVQAGVTLTLNNISSEGSGRLHLSEGSTLRYTAGWSLMPDADDASVSHATYRVPGMLDRVDNEGGSIWTCLMATGSTDSASEERSYTRLASVEGNIDTLLVSSGLLLVASDEGESALAGVGSLALDGAGLLTHASASGVAATVSRDITLGAQGGTLRTYGDGAADATTTYAGAISGSGTLTKADAGTIVLDGDMSAFSGNVNVQAGALAFGQNVNAPSINEMWLKSGVTVDFGASDAVTANVIYVEAGSGDTFLKGQGAVSGAIRQRGDSLILAGADTVVEALRYVGADADGAYTQLTVRDDATLTITGTTWNPSHNSIPSQAALVLGHWPSEGSLSISDGGTVNVLGSGISVKDGTGEVLIGNGGTLNIKTLGANKVDRVSVVLEAGGTINIGSGGIGNASATNSTTGNNFSSFTINGGTLGILSDTASWSTTENLTLSGNLVINTELYDAVERAYTGVGGTITLGGDVVTNGHSLIKQGEGVLSFGADAAIGTLDIQEGVLLASAGLVVDNLTLGDSASILYTADATHTVTAENYSASLNLVLRGLASGASCELFQGAAGLTADAVTLDTWQMDRGLQYSTTVSETGLVTVAISGEAVTGATIEWTGSENAAWSTNWEHNWSWNGADDAFRSGDHVVFGGTGGTVTVQEEGVTAGSLRVTGTGYIFDGGKITTSSVTVEDGASASFLRGSVNNSLGDVTVEGTGSLTLEHEGNIGAILSSLTYTGAGSLAIGGGTVNLNKAIVGEGAAVSLTVKEGTTLTISSKQEQLAHTLVEEGATLVLNNIGSGVPIVYGKIEVRGMLKAHGDAFGWALPEANEMTGLDIIGGTLRLTNGNTTMVNTPLVLSAGRIELDCGTDTSRNDEDGMDFFSAGDDVVQTLASSAGQSVICVAEGGNASTSSMANKLTLRQGDVVFDIARADVLKGTETSDLRVDVGVIEATDQNGASSQAGSFVKTGDGVLEMTVGFLANGNKNVDVALEEGTLRMSGSATLGRGNLVMSEGATLEFATEGDMTVSKNISGSGTIVKMGSNAITLEALSADWDGRLELQSGSLALAEGESFTLDAGRTLAMVSGTFNADLLLSGGVLELVAGSPVSLGGHTLTIGSGTTLLLHEAMVMALEAENAAREELTLLTDVVLADSELFAGEGALAADWFSGLDATKYGDARLVYDAAGQTLKLTYEVVPEPTTATLSLLALAALAARRRRR